MKPTKKQMLIALLIEVAIYIVASLCFFQGFQILCTDLYDFSHVLMVMPMFLSYTVPTYWLFAFHALLREPKEETRNKLFFGNAIGLIATGAILTVLVFVNIFMGNYVMGWVNAIFPIDMILIDIITIGFGLLFLLKKDLVSKIIPGLENDSKMPKALKIIGIILGGLYVVIQEYLFGGWLHAGEFIDNIRTLFRPILLSCFLGSFIMLLNEIIVMKKNGKGIKPLTIYILCGIFGLLTILSGAFVIATNFTPDSNYIALNFQWFFVLDYIASLNLAPYLTSILPMVACLIYAADIVVSKKSDKK